MTYGKMLVHDLASFEFGVIEVDNASRFMPRLDIDTKLEGKMNE